MSRATGEADLPSAWASWRTILATAWQVWRFGAIVTISGWFVTTLLAGPIFGIALQRLVEGRGFADPVWIGLVAIGVVVPEVLLSVTDHVREIMQRLGEQKISHEIIRAALRPHGLEHLEDPQYADRVAFIRKEAASIAAVFGEVGGQAGLLLALAASLAILASVSLWLLVPVIGSILLGVIQIRAARWAAAVQERATVHQRLADRLVAVATSPSSAPDVRMYGLGQWLLDRFDDSTGQVGSQLLHSERRNVAVAGLSGGFQALMLALGLGLLVWLSTRGQATPGDVVLGVVLLQTVMETARGLAATAARVSRVSFASRRYLWLLRFRTAVTVPQQPTQAPAGLTGGIRLHDVTFSYPLTSKVVLRDVSLFLPAGSTVALVGDNGAGKSTLVKLLCRFYDPNHGKITVDEIDLRDMDLDGWRRRITAGFQDFAKLQFTASDSIGASLLDILDSEVPAQDRQALIVAAAQAAGADRFLSAMSFGYDTQLGRRFGGEELSEGQWQRIAMARAFLRDDALLTLLDEPTAALDPRAEHALFEHFVKHTRDGRRRGAITLLVSHRFSTVSMADLIVVMANGTVVEHGTHERLMSVNGQYRRMYDAQASRYL